MKNTLYLFFFIPMYMYAQTDTGIFRKHIDQNGPQILEDFVELLSIPNVAYDLPNISKNANYIKAELEKR